MNAKEKILIVDDDENMLAACRRRLGRAYDVHTAVDGLQGLAKISELGPFSVVISDYQMPGMDGFRFLAKAAETAPDSARILLTGNADLDLAIRSVNEGRIFRFLTKPITADLLDLAIQQGIERRRLETAEKELLEKTLNGSVKLLTDILSMVDPEEFGRAARLRSLAKRTADLLNVEKTWEIELAAMLAQIGRVTAPPDLLERVRAGKPVSDQEREIVLRIPEVGRKFLSNIPRLDAVAEIILFQSKHYDGSGFPEDDRAGEAIPLGARILRALSDFLLLEWEGHSPPDIVARMKGERGKYDPAILGVIESNFSSAGAQDLSRRLVLKHVSREGLRLGDVLMSPVKTAAGKLLMASGAEVTPAMLARIRAYGKVMEIVEPIQVGRSQDQEDAETAFFALNL